MVQPETPDPELEESSDSIRHYMSALQSACHSLVSITIDFASLSTTRALALREFDALKTLRMNWDHQLFGKTSKKPRMHSVGLPPQLENLEFFNEVGTDEEVVDLLLSTIQIAPILARNWSSLVIVDCEDRVRKQIIEACEAQPQLELDIIGRIDHESDDNDIEEQ